MRAALVEVLSELAARDERVVLLTADLGFMVVERFSAAHPKKFFNVGVAEQNMVGLATGLAEAGFIPFVYSIAPFATLRTFEFIRNGPVMHRLPVRVVGIGSGFDYGHNGLTHYSVEDIGVTRTQPDLMVIAPADSQQAREALRRTWDLPGPIYYRLGKDDRIVAHGLNGRFSLERGETLREGADALLLTAGAISAHAVAAADILAAQGISCTLVVIACLNPAPTESLAQTMAKFAHVFTVEDHYLNGGLGSIAAEVIAERGLNCRLGRFGINRAVEAVSGSQPYLHDHYSLSPEKVAAGIAAALRPKGRRA